MRTVKCPSLSNKLPGTPLSSNPTREEFRPSRRCRVWSTRCKRVHNLETPTGSAVIMVELGASSEGRGMQNALWIGVFLRNRNPYCTSIKGTTHVMFESHVFPSTMLYAFSRRLRSSLRMETTFSYRTPL